jgi:hypothetical protein
MSHEPDRVIRELRGVTVRFGGEEHSGWLPPGASWPPPTSVEVAVVDFEIIEQAGGYTFEYHSRNTRHWGDTWHETLEDALEYAEEYFGIEPKEWQSAGSSAN